jgi:hypothetical protein
MKRERNEYDKFNDMMVKLIKVPRSELKAKLDAEKATKKQKPKASASARASGAKN